MGSQEVCHSVARYVQINTPAMPQEQFFLILLLLLPLTVAITYFDVKHRRIPNKIVLTTLFGGLIINLFGGGWSGLLSGLEGCLVGFGLMLLLHFFGAMGAGDVKLFAAIGGLIGAGLVLKTFFVVVFVGVFLAVVAMFYTGTVGITMQRVMLILAGFFQGWQMPRYQVTPDRHTIPYGVAITLGTLLSLLLFPH